MRLPDEYEIDRNRHLVRAFYADEAESGDSDGWVDFCTEIDVLTVGVDLITGEGTAKIQF